MMVSDDKGHRTLHVDDLITRMLDCLVEAVADTITQAGDNPFSVRAGMYHALAKCCARKAELADFIAAQRPPKAGGKVARQRRKIRPDHGEKIISSALGGGKPNP